MDLILLVIMTFVLGYNLGFFIRDLIESKDHKKYRFSELPTKPFNSFKKGIEVKCCNKARYVKAYVWFWPFKAKYCLNCKEVIGDTGFILEWLWQLFVWPFWDGRVKVFERADKMKRLHELTPQQIEEWRQARLAWGQTIYGDRDLQRYNLVDVMEELLDCLNILERFQNRTNHQNFNSDCQELLRLIIAINQAMLWLIDLDKRIPNEMCTDENGGERIGWNK